MRVSVPSGGYTGSDARSPSPFASPLVPRLPLVSSPPRLPSGLPCFSHPPPHLPPVWCISGPRPQQALTHRMVMARRSPSAHTQELCVWLCVLHCSISLGPLSAEGARLRCGSELLGDLIFVCGDRGIYLGRRGWSGYGPRPRSRGIVDQCCLGPGCDLHHLEKYCAKAKGLSTTTTSSTQGPTTEQQFVALFQKKLVERLGAPGSPQREDYRKSSKASAHRPLTAPRSRTKTGASTGLSSAAPQSPTAS